MVQLQLGLIFMKMLIVRHKAEMAPLSKMSSTLVSATDVGELYAVVDMSRKKGAKMEGKEKGCTVTNKDDLYPCQ